MGDALHTHGGVVSAQEARLADAGLLAVQGPTPADVRTGVMFGPGTTQLVTGTNSTAPMRYAIAPHQWVTSRGAAQGPYRGSLDAVQLVDTTAAPGSGSRIDLVFEKQQDATPGVPSPDATTAPLYGVVQGQSTTGTPQKPDLPVGAIELATVVVAAGATRTDGAGVTITNTARQTVARGADIPVRDEDERDALPKYIGLTVLRLDDGGRVERYTGVGNVWAAEGDTPVLASIAVRNTYFDGNLRAGASALVAGNQHVYDGAAWRFDLSGTAEGVTDGNGFFDIPHGAGQAPRQWFLTLPGQSTDPLTQVLKVVAWGQDGINLLVRASRTDTHNYFAGTPLRVHWLARF